MTQQDQMSIFKLGDAPDVAKEMNELCDEIGKALIPIINKAKPQVALGALGFIHASLVTQLIKQTPESMKRAANMEAISLIRNIELLCKGTPGEFTLQPPGKNER